MMGLEIRKLLNFSFADIQLKGFAESGRVYHETALADGRDSESLTSAGLDLTALIAGKYSVDFQWASPLDGNDSGDGDDSRFWLALTAMYRECSSHGASVEEREIILTNQSNAILDTTKQLWYG